MNLNPIGAIIDAVGGVVGDLVTTDKERLTAEIEMAKVDASLLVGQMEVNKVEAASDSLWVAGLAASKEAITDIAKAWESASLVLVFVKSLSKLVPAVTIIWGAWKFGFTGKGDA